MAASAQRHPISRFHQFPVGAFDADVSRYPQGAIANDSDSGGQVWLHCLIAGRCIAIDFNLVGKRARGASFHHRNHLVSYAHITCRRHHLMQVAEPVKTITRVGAQTAIALNANTGSLDIVTFDRYLALDSGPGVGRFSAVKIDPRV